jgi:serine/threonine-protein kinase
MTDLRERIMAAAGYRYEIEREIGRGGMGIVYRARDVRLRRPVALKVLPPEFAFHDDIRARFMREAQMAAQLTHPNIVPIYGVDDGGGLVWFAMGLVEGESLAARLVRDRRPPVDFVRRVLHDVADALGYAHSHGIVHRDIKPDNILIEQATGRPLVTDFGIARAAEGESRLTLTGMTVGTPAYMSPEQARGERDLDGRTDVYSLAVVGFQMLAGELPFVAANTPAMLLKHLNEPAPVLSGRRPDAPAALCAAIDRALAKPLDDRWPTAGAFRDALAAAPSAADAGAPRSSPTDALLAAQQLYRVPRLDEVARNARLGAELARSPLEAPAPPPRPLPAHGDERARRERHDGAGGALAPARPPLVAWPGAAWPERPSLPPWMPSNWRDVRRQWRDDPALRGMSRRELRWHWRNQLRGELTVEDRIRSFRRRLARNTVTLGMLLGINVITSPGTPWVIFPAVFMGIGLLRRAGSLWAEGVRFGDVFGRHKRLFPVDPAAAAHAPPEDAAWKLVPAEVLRGTYGNAVRRAADDQAVVRDAVAKLAPTDRDLIPDVQPTVDALVHRVASLAQALHRLEADVRPDALAELDARIARTQSESLDANDRQRRLELLERQRTTLGELMNRREAMRTQLESASLMLQNVRLDMLALRSAGVQAALDDVSSATQEARALTRDIEHVLDAAKELTRLT